MICHTGVMVGRGSLMELTDAMDRSTLQRIGEILELAKLEAVTHCWGAHRRCC